MMRAGYVFNVKAIAISSSPNDDDCDFIRISATYPIPKDISRAVARRETNASTTTCSSSDALLVYEDFTQYPEDGL